MSLSPVFASILGEKSGQGGGIRDRLFILRFLVAYQTMLAKAAAESQGALCLLCGYS